MQISERVDKVLGDLLGRGVEWSRETMLKAQAGLDLDAIDMVELGMMLEEEFQFRVPEDDLEANPRIETVGDVVELVERLASTKRALFA
jgi:acyl carrier protein